MQIQTRSSNPVCALSWIVSHSIKWDIWPAGGVVVLWIEAWRGLQLAAHEGRAAVVVLPSASRRPRRVTVLPPACGGTAEQSGQGDAEVKVTHSAARRAGVCSKGIPDRGHWSVSVAASLVLSSVTPWSRSQCHCPGCRGRLLLSHCQERVEGETPSMLMRRNVQQIYSSRLPSELPMEQNREGKLIFINRQTTRDFKMQNGESLHLHAIKCFFF